ncbi:hypothetical protein Hanom_Chr16g01417671 [Helianthus anomalus]
MFDHHGRRHRCSFTAKYPLLVSCLHHRNISDGGWCNLVVVCGGGCGGFLV